MYIYILKCNNGRYYTGSTPDLERRLAEHNRGKSKATKHLLTVKLVFSQQFNSLKIARRAEAWLKKQKDKSLLDRIISAGIITKSFE